jgi:RNA polymerase sigma factor (sigma-70 family)
MEIIGMRDKNNIEIDELFSSVFKFHFDALYNYGMKITHNSDLVKDSIQELFFRMWKNNIDFESVTYLKPYLMKGLRRQITNVLELKYNKIEKLEVEENIRVEFSPEDYLIENQSEEALRMKVLNALNLLSSRQREAIYLRYFESLDYEDIAEIMNINLQSVKNNVHRGLTALKDLLDILLIFSILQKSFQ